MNYPYTVLLKMASSILKDDRSAWEKLWDEHGGTIVLCALGALILVISVLFFIFELYLPQRTPKPKETVTINGEQVLSKKTCTITLTSFATLSHVKGTEFVAPLHSKDGYQFSGWFYDTACTIPYTTTKVKKNITLYPKWTKDS